MADDGWRTWCEKHKASPKLILARILDPLRTEGILRKFKKLIYPKVEGFQK
jgi:hypothetical protein